MACRQRPIRIPWLVSKHVDNDQFGFHGLAKSTYHLTYLDGSDNNETSSWWHAVGSALLHTGGIPGHERKIAYRMELWARSGALLLLFCSPAWLWFRGMLYSHVLFGVFKTGNTL